MSTLHILWVVNVCRKRPELNMGKVFWIFGCVALYMLSVIIFAAIVWKYSSAVHIHSERWLGSTDPCQNSWLAKIFSEGACPKYEDIERMCTSLKIVILASCCIVQSISTVFIMYWEAQIKDQRDQRQEVHFPY